MSRPIKQGLDYFPLDVDMDDKIELIEAKHGISGFGILIKLFQKIYKEGYFLNWNNETSLLFSKRINVNINEVNAVINDCFLYQIFSEELYKGCNILTSSGIQKRYLTAVDRRKEVVLDKRYVIADINEVNVNIKWINTVNSTQSKVKESKVKESKEVTSDKLSDLTERIVNAFVEEHGSYEIIAMGKERSMADKIIGLYKKRYPDATPEEVIDGLKPYFRMCLDINDEWLRNNMSLSMIVSKFNEINKILSNGSSKRKSGTGKDPERIARIIAKFITNPEEPKEGT